MRSTGKVRTPGVAESTRTARRVLSVAVALAFAGCLDWDALYGERCGDGTVNGREECDDGNTTAGDGCGAGAVGGEVRAGLTSGRGMR